MSSETLPLIVTKFMLTLTAMGFSQKKHCHLQTFQKKHCHLQTVLTCKRWNTFSIQIFRRITGSLESACIVIKQRISISKSHMFES